MFLSVPVLCVAFIYRCSHSAQHTLSCILDKEYNSFIFFPGTAELESKARACLAMPDYQSDSGEVLLEKARKNYLEILNKSYKI